MKKILSIFVSTAIALLLLSACSNNGSSPGTNGQLSFNHSSYQAQAGSLTEMLLNLTGSTNTSGVAASISSSNQSVAVIVNNFCTLSDESGFPSSCEVVLKGLAIGSTTITASAAGVVSATVTVTVTNNVTPGALAITPSIDSITLGGDKRVAVTLNGSSGVSNLQVNLASLDDYIASAEQTSCILSSLDRNCEVIINGNKVGTTTITASASGYSSADDTVQVLKESQPGTLAFTANKQLQLGKSEEATLSLTKSSGINDLTVLLASQNSNATVEPTTCTLSNAKPNCYVKVTGVSAGNDKLIATAAGYANAGAVVNVITTAVKGSLYFEKSAESIAANASGNVELLYTGGSGVESLPVTISANNNNLTFSPLNCNMNTNSACKITISGITQGQTILTAHAAGYPDTTNTVTIKQNGAVIYGKLILMPKNKDLFNGSSLPMTLSLIDSSNVESLVVNLAETPAGVVSLSTTTCKLSSISNTCSFKVTGTSNGTATISASNSYITTPAQATVTVTAKAATFLAFSPDRLILSNQTTTAQTTTLTLVNAAANPITVTFDTPSTIANSPGMCTLSQANPSCVVNINNVLKNGPSGTFYFSAIPSLPSIARGQLPVVLAPATAVQRTITVINLCPFPVYAGITGSAANLTRGPKPGICPSGTIDSESKDANGYELCYWKNPAPTTSYKLTTNQQTQFVIPTSSLDSVGAMWNGGIMARLKKSTSWIIGSCNGGQESLGDACATGVGFSVPETVAEMNITPEGLDNYDIQLIDGVTVPISMSPNGVTADPGNPYNNGIAGATTQQTGSQYTLFASSWEFTPNAFGSTNSTTYYNYVSGTAGVSDACSTDSGCNSNPNGPVCGYAANSLMKPSPTYARTCGYRLGYLTAAAIYTMNPSTANSAPFNFNQVLDTDLALPYPNSNNNPMHDFYLCNAGAAQSGYQPTTVYPQACGCFNWNSENIATPTSQCAGTAVSTYTTTTQGIGFNSAWINQVLPRVKWIKQGCPTCYSFQYDDPSSTFQGYQQASSTNAANAANYSITFCPSGKHIPNPDPNLNY